MARVRDVARLAGVSVGTVSNVLNNTAGVAGEKRRKVLEAVRTLNYRPNAIARSLVQRRTRAIGLVIADITKSFYPAVVKGVQEVLAREGYSLFLTNSDYRTEIEEACLEQLRTGFLDGVIFMSSSKQTETGHLLAAREAGYPIVTINRPVQAGPIDQVRYDIAGSVARSVQHLTDLGHVRIGFISGPRGSLEYPTPYTQRFIGFRHGKEAAGLSINPAWVAELPDGEYETGFACIKELHRASEGPTAWIVCSDLLALGVLNGLRTMGVIVPDDVAIVGFDGMPAGAYSLPGLTTVCLPIQKGGTVAAEMMVRRLRNPQAPPERVTLSCDLLVRGSCGATTSVPEQSGTSC